MNSFRTSGVERTSATLIACVSDTERTAIRRLAQAHDRTVSREVRRAIRAYLLDPEAADRALRSHEATQ